MTATTYRVRRYGSDVYATADRRDDAYRLASLRPQCAECGVDILADYSAARTHYSAARAIFEFPSLHAEPAAYLVAVCVPCAPTIAERLALSGAI